MDFVPTPSVYSIGAVLSALLTGSVAVWLARQPTADAGADSDAVEMYPDLVRPFALTLAAFTASALGFAVLFANGTDGLGFGWGFPTVPLIAVPWAVFALRYAGRERLVTRLRVAVLSLGALVLTALTSAAFVLGLSAEMLPDLVFPVFATLVLLFPALIFVVSGFVLISSYRHGKYTLVSGVLVVLPVAELLFVGQLNNPGLPTWSAAVLTAGQVVAAVTLVVSVTRYDVLRERPGTGTVGERHVVEEMDEAVFVVGSRGDVARANETAERLFGPGTEGAQFGDVLDCTVTELADRGTIERWTDRRRMRFDPRVSTLTDSQGRTLGHAVTLLDVTDREIRQQRIQVLNRILRHNLRNNVDVITAHAEAGAGGGAEPATHFDSILDAAAELEGLSDDARRVEQVVNEWEASRRPVDVQATVETVAKTVTDARGGDVTVSVDTPRSTVQTSERLLSFAVRNLVENAIEHNDAPAPRVAVRGSVTASGVELAVVDDGPGIPEAERAVLEAGEEVPLEHATGIGLWSTKWAVETMGGALSFGESDLGGAAVRITLPNAASEG